MHAGQPYLVLAIAKTACLQGYTGSCNLRLLCENRIFCASVGSVRVRARTCASQNAVSDKLPMSVRCLRVRESVHADYLPHLQPKRP